MAAATRPCGNENASSIVQLDAEPLVHRVQVDGGAGLPGGLRERGQDGRTRIDQRHVEVEPVRPRSADASPVIRSLPVVATVGGALGRRHGMGELCSPTAWPAGGLAGQPWEGDVVAKVGGKIFAFFGSGGNPSVGRSAEPAAGSRRGAATVSGGRVRDGIHRPPGWNTLRIGGAIPDDELVEAIDDLLLGRGQQTAEEGPSSTRRDDGSDRCRGDR